MKQKMLQQINIIIKTSQLSSSANPTKNIPLVLHSFGQNLIYYLFLIISQEREI